MYTAACTPRKQGKVIDLAEARRRERAAQRRDRWYFLLAVVPQYLSLAALALYALLRVTVAAAVPFSYYMGPLTVLWPAAFLLLLLSYVSDLLLWRE